MLRATGALCCITRFITSFPKWGSDPDFYVLKGRRVLYWLRGAMTKIIGLGFKLRFRLSKCISLWHQLKGYNSKPQEHPSSQGGSLPCISAEELPQEFLQPNTVCWRTSLTALTLVPLSHISVSLHLVKSSLWGITLKSHKKQDVSNVNDQIKPALHRQHT